MSVVPILSDSTIYRIILTLCFTFTINHFVKLLFKHIDKDPDKILEYKNIINELKNNNFMLSENIKSLNSQMDKLNIKVNELDKLNKSSKKYF